MSGKTTIPEVHTIVHASTAHLAEGEWRALGEWADREPFDAGEPAPPYRTIRHGLGYLIHTHGDREQGEEDRQEAREAGMRDGFFAPLDHARKHGHRWLNIDRDYDLIEKLPVQERT